MSRRNPRDRRVKMLRLWLRALRKDARREADAFEGTVVAGDDLKVSANGKLTAGVQAGEEVIAQAISVSGGTIKFRLLI